MAIDLRAAWMARGCDINRCLLLILLLGGLALAFFAAYGQAADESGKPAKDRPLTVAIVDVARVVASHKQLEARKRELDAEMREAEKQLADEKAVVQELKNQRDAHEKESGEYAKLDALLRRKQTEVAISVAQTRKRFLAREVELYRDAYKQITRAAEAYLSERGVQIVLTRNWQTAWPFQNHDDAVRVPQFDVVLACQAGLDVTDDIIARVHADR
jgi:Skp family chaperone for outer membrane proteins